MNSNIKTILIKNKLIKKQSIQNKKHDFVLTLKFGLFSFYNGLDQNIFKTSCYQTIKTHLPIVLHMFFSWKRHQEHCVI